MTMIRMRLSAVPSGSERRQLKNLRFPDVIPEMKHSNRMEVLVLMLGGLVVLVGLYTGGYLLSVRRGVWPQEGLLVPGVKSTYFAVGVSFKSGFSANLFGPAYSIDTRWIRPRYWSGWHVVPSTNGPKTYYDIDFIEYKVGTNTYYSVP